MKTVTCFEIVDHGIDQAQYFQGCGVGRTKFSDVATGCGDNPAEALSDALETLAQDGWDVSKVAESAEGLAYAKAEKPSASAEVREQLIADTVRAADESDEDFEARIDELLSDCDSELYYYLSVSVTDQTDWDETPEGFVDYLLPASWASYLINGDASGLANGEPAPWASYLINGDASGLANGEQERIDAFLASERLPSPVDCESEASFCHGCDAPGELAGDMLLFRFPVAP